MQKYPKSGPSLNAGGRDGGKPGFKKGGRDLPVRKNEWIKTRFVRLVSEDGQSTLVSNAQAQAAAKAAGKDLVEVGFQKDSQGNPVSVAKIMDYSKYVYEKKRMEKEARKRERSAKTETKNLQLHIVTDDGDRIRKIEKAKEFIAEGYRVCFEIYVRAREMRSKSFAVDLMNRVIKDMSDVAVPFNNPELVGNSIKTYFRKI